MHTQEVALSPRNGYCSLDVEFCRVLCCPALFNLSPFYRHFQGLSPLLSPFSGFIATFIAIFQIYRHFIADISILSTIKIRQFSRQSRLKNWCFSKNFAISRLNLVYISSKTHLFRRENTLS